MNCRFRATRGVIALTAIAVAVLTSTALAQQAPLYRLADIDAGFEDTGSFGRVVGTAAGHTYLSAFTPSRGAELWRSDDTEAGTRLVKDLNPGSHGTEIFSGATEIAGILYFIADIDLNPSGGLYSVDRNLWRSDGTAEGTHRVLPGLDLGGEAQVNPQLAVVGDEVFFFGVTTGGQLLYTSDGTAAGTAPVLPTPFPGDISAATRHGGLLYFVQSAYPASTQLWRSDGTPAGTHVVGPGPNGAASTLLSVGAFLYFVRDSNLWRSDGTPAGTAPVTSFGDVDAGYFLAGGLQHVGDRVYFLRSTYGQFSSADLDLWWIEGTTLSPGAVHRFAISSEGSSGLQVVPAGNRLFVAVRPGPLPPFGPPIELWVSNGTPVGTNLVRTFPDAFGGFAAVGNDILLLADEGDHGREIWRSDGSMLGTYLAADIRPGATSSEPHNLSAADSRVYLTANDGVHGLEPWLVNSAGTSASLLRNIAIDPGSSQPQGPSTSGDSALFVAIDSAGAADLWTTDGLVAGTTRVTTDGGNGRDASYYEVYAAAEFNHGISIFHDTLGDFSGRRIWRTDGTQAGTLPIVTFPYTGVGSRLPGRVYTLPDAWLMTAAELSPNPPPVSFIRTDGTPAGTTNPDLGIEAFEEIFEDRIGGQLLLAARGVGDTAGFELWRTDGTSDGTERIADLNPGPGWSYPSGFVADSVHHALFRAFSPHSSYQLWGTDGTLGGEVLIADFGALNSGGNQSSGFIGPFKRLDSATGPILIFGPAPGIGTELWRIDEGALPTLVREINPGPEGSRDSCDTEMFLLREGVMLFGAREPDRGCELWRSDGTPAGTTLLRDVLPGASGGISKLLLVVDEHLIFIGCDADGCEPWVSDGTPTGTHQLMDIWPGALSSDPRLFTHVGSRVLLTADDGATGREVWALRVEALDDGPILEGDLDGDGFVALDDRALFASAFGTRVGDVGFLIAADLDGDGSVTLVDYQRWVANYPKQPDPIPPGGVPGVPIVPFSVAMLLAGALGAATIWRSRCAQ